MKHIRNSHPTVRFRVKLTRIIIPGSTALSNNLSGIYVGNLVFLNFLSVLFLVVG